MWAEMIEYGWWAAFGIAHMLVVWGLVVTGILALVHVLVGSNGGVSRATETGHRTGLETLDERYAQGQFDHNKYRQRLGGLKTM